LFGFMQEEVCALYKNEVVQSVRVSMHSATLAMSVEVTTVH